MWWSVFVCCLAIVFGDDFDSAKSADVVESTFAITKDLIIQLLSNSEAFHRQKDSLFDAFCIKDVLEHQKIQKFKVANDTHYGVDLNILGGLGSEDSIGECLDENVFIRKMDVSLLLLASNKNAELWTSSFSLHNVHITEQESNAMIVWLKNEPNHVQTLIQEGKLKLDEVPWKFFFHVLARHFPQAPWMLKPTISQASQSPFPGFETLLQLSHDLSIMSDSISRMSDDILNMINDRLVFHKNLLPGNIPSLQGGSALPRQVDPLRRGGIARGKTIAKPRFK